MAVHSENEPIAKMFKEIGGYYWKDKDMRRGATYSVSKFSLHSVNTVNQLTSKSLGLAIP